MKLFDAAAASSPTRTRRRSRRCSTRPRATAARSSDVDGAADAYLERVLGALRLRPRPASGSRVDCANGAFSGLAPRAFERLGADGDRDRQRARRDEHQRRLRRHRHRRACSSSSRAAASTSGSRSTATATGSSRSTSAASRRRRPDRRDPRARPRRRPRRGHADDEPRLPRADGASAAIRVVTTDVGDRYILEALRREGGVLGGEQSGHVIYLRDHVTGDGLAAALLLCAALRGRRLSEAAAVMPRYPQAKENVRGRVERADGRRSSRRSSASTRSSPARAACSSGRRARSRSSACSPRPRARQVAAEACASIAALVRRELG